MAILDSPDFFGHTVFCDDIREERSGKISYIGSYGGVMIVHGAFPFSLPKFGFGVAFTQKKAAIVADLGIRIFLPGDVEEPEKASLQADFGENSEGAMMAAAAAATPLPEDQQKYLNVRVNLTFAPLVIKQPGTLRVRVLRSGDLVKVGSLLIAPSAETKPANQTSG